jgi:hypothetical protein
MNGSRPSHQRALVGRVLLVSAALMLLISALLWFGVIAVGAAARPFVAGAFFAAGLVEGFVGLRFVGEA